MAEIQPVRGGRDLRRFVRLPWDLYRGDPLWVPPLVSADLKLLDRSRNPFWKHAEAEHFLAVQGGRPVGRISAIVNHQHNEVHGERTGWFGFFETPDDPAIAGTLLEAAGAWLRARGMDRVRGPASPSTNDPCGALVEGFDKAPFILMPYNQAHLPRLIEGAGFAKAMDLLAYILLNTALVRQKIDRVASHIQARNEVRVRNLELSRFEEDLSLLMEIYNDAWSKNWGFVPMTRDEVLFMAEDLKPIVLPELIYFAELGDEVIGFALALPDINPALKRANGRLFPFGWIQFLRPMLRRIPTFRIMALGVKKAHQHLGVGTLFYQRYMIDALAAGYAAAELSWVLESNDLMNRPLRMMGGQYYKRYRIYEKTLAV